MKPLSPNPLTNQRKAIELLCQDILDRKAKGFDRLDALGGVLRGVAK